MSTELATVDHSTGEIVPTADLVHGLSPAQRIGIAAEAASEAGKLIKAHGLTKRIQNRDYLVVEGWQLFAQALDMTIICEDVKPLPDGHGWHATAVVRTADGREVGRGSTVVTRDEKRWKDAEEYAVMSMAQTRAIGRAARAALGYVAVAAGYEPTPADEVPNDGQQQVSLPPWAMSADQAQLRDATTSALDAIGIKGDDQPPYGKALLQAVKAATGGTLPAIAITILRTVAETQDAFYAEMKAARETEDAAARDDGGEAVTPDDVQDPPATLPGVAEPTDQDLPNGPYDVGA